MDSIQIIKNYTVDDFYEVKNTIREQLGDINYFSDNVKSFFEKLIQNNSSYVRKKKPYHQQNEEWRKKKVTQHIKNVNQDQNEKIYQELKGLLNRISPNNYQSISDEINKSIDNYQDPEDREHYYDMFLNDLLKKARMEPNYCIYYVKILLSLNDKDIVNDFIGILKEQYNTIIKTLKPIDSKQDTTKDEENDDEEESYDDFCISRKNKNFQKGLSQFIAELFNSHKISINEVISYLTLFVQNIIGNILHLEDDTIFDNIQKISHKSIEDNILYLAPLVEKTIEQLMKINLQNYQTDKINTLFKNIESLSENKLIQNKNRYLLADLIDLYNQQKKLKQAQHMNSRFRNNHHYNNIPNHNNNITTANNNNSNTNNNNNNTTNNNSNNNNNNNNNKKNFKSRNLDHTNKFEYRKKNN